MAVHDEGSFGTTIIQHLCANGYVEGKSNEFDAELALIRQDVLDFVETTQPKVWAELKHIHKSKLPTELIKVLIKEINNKGILSVFRQGFKFFGKTLKIATFRPAHSLNPEIEAKYQANCLKVIPELYFDPKTKDRLDLCIFLNGIPIVTAELKNPMTGQNYKHAIKQYCEDRSPKAPIFEFKRRTLVHFAVDPDHVEMTTRLSGTDTRFLPFNRGHNKGAGNPPMVDKHRTYYLWEEVLERHSLLDLVGRFLHLQVTHKKQGKTKKKSEVMIFPRYHQLDAVRKLVAAATENGAGTNYLVQHSAGSGKSNTIAWLTHRLQSLHDANDKKIYDSVVVITDRQVLDTQLQETIYQFDHVKGVVKCIDDNSKQLGKALEDRVPVIISTIHKFGFIQGVIEKLPERRYAVVVDEAHSSQSGSMSKDMKEALASAQVKEKLKDKEGELPQHKYEAERSALLRGKQSNLSFFAFTATPKPKTLELFGHTDAEGMPAAFHLYSMKQAIEEEFILDVLDGYVTYQTFFKIVSKAEQDKKVEKKAANRSLARFLALHPYNISQKVTVIVEHFRTTVRGQLKGREKAMVVTGSRLQAVKYKKAFDKYIAVHGYENLKTLVAFSGKVTEEIEGVKFDYTEPKMNNGLGLKELPEAFESDDYQVLIVADKYQTGFDQPLLCAMYVDKQLRGIQAVQTLSRLNRKCLGKDHTFVLDFVNTQEDILKAFKPFYERTEIEETVDAYQLETLKTKLFEDFEILWPQEIESFARVFFKPTSNKKKNGHGSYSSRLAPAVDRYKASAEEEQLEFKTTLAAFVKLYVFVTQVMPYHDPDLEELYAFGRLLLVSLRDTSDRRVIDLGQDVALQYYRLKRIEEGKIKLGEAEDVKLKGPSAVGTGKIREEEKVELSKLIDILNEKLGTDFTEADQLFFDQIKAEALADEKLKEAALANTEEGFGFRFKEVFDDLIIQRHEENETLVNKALEDEDFGKLLEDLLRGAIYEEMRRRAS